MAGSGTLQPSSIFFFIRALSQTNDRPAVLFRVPPEGWIGVRRHRVGDFVQQRQVIQRVAVEPAFEERQPGQVALVQPAFQPDDFAFSETGYP